MVQWGDGGITKADLQSVLLNIAHGIPMMRPATRNPGPLRTRRAADRKRNKGGAESKGRKKGATDGGKPYSRRGTKAKGKAKGKTKGKIVRHCEGPIDPIHPRGQSPATSETTALKDSRA